MPIGVSYFGNRILRHVAADMDDLAARGFTGVLHTMSENDLTYYRDTIGRLVESQEKMWLKAGCKRLPRKPLQLLNPRNAELREQVERIRRQTE